MVEHKEKANKLLQSSSMIDSTLKALPALKHAHKIQQHAAYDGFDWQDKTHILDKIHEELQELQDALKFYEETNKHHDHIIEELGDCLFAITNYARHLNIDSEMALKQANQKFIHRYKKMEILANDIYHRPFSTLSIQEKQALWQQVKITDNNNKRY